MSTEALVRKFETGATRSADAGRYDPEGFLSPMALERFCEYMQKHRVQPDGSVRASDNWQKGIPREAYAKGAWRHFLHFSARHRGYPVRDAGAAANIEEDLCALMFNVMGYLHELRMAAVKVEEPPLPFGSVLKTSVSMFPECAPGKKHDADEFVEIDEDGRPRTRTPVPGYDQDFATRIAGYGTDDWSNDNG